MNRQISICRTIIVVGRSAPHTAGRNPARKGRVNIMSTRTIEKQYSFTTSNGETRTTTIYTYGWVVKRWDYRGEWNRTAWINGGTVVELERSGFAGHAVFRLRWEGKLPPVWVGCDVFPYVVNSAHVGTMETYEGGGNSLIMDISLWSDTVDWQLVEEKVTRLMFGD